MYVQERHSCGYNSGATLWTGLIRLALLDMRTLHGRTCVLKLSVTFLHHCPRLSSLAPHSTVCDLNFVNRFEII